MIGTELEKEGQTIRKYYQRRLPSDPSKDYYYMIRNTPNTQAMLIEYGFLDNEADANKLKNNWEEYAEAVVRAVASYVGVPYVGVGGAGEYYTVTKGDSLWSIARKFNTTVDKLKELNNLSSNLLSVGQTLKIGDNDEPLEEDYYIVKKGDTLYGIAMAYGLTVARLKELNNLTSNNLSIGQRLKVMDTPTMQNDDNYYTVVSGDTLYAIANKFNTTVDKIKQANNLTSNNLSIGQKLVIPDENNYQVYTVVSGDTLYGIARKFNTTVSAIESLNNLNTSTLSIGQKLLIP